MFLKLLKKLATEYRADQTYFGGDVAEDLRSIDPALGRPGDAMPPPLTAGYFRVLYDLGLLVALPAPADGEVRVAVAFAKRLIDVIEGAERLAAARCYGCKVVFAPGAERVRLRYTLRATTLISDRCGGGTAGSTDLSHDADFCPNCASVAGTEWRRS
jgi:hypothetical protein